MLCYVNGRSGGSGPSSGVQGQSPGGGVGAKPPAGCAWSVRDCSGNPAGSRMTQVILYVFDACRVTFVVRYMFVGCRGIGAESPTPELCGGVTPVIC